MYTQVSDLLYYDGHAQCICSRGAPMYHTADQLSSCCQHPEDLPLRTTICPSGVPANSAASRSPTTTSVTCPLRCSRQYRTSLPADVLRAFGSGTALLLRRPVYSAATICGVRVAVLLRCCDAV